MIPEWVLKDFRKIVRMGFPRVKYESLIASRNSGGYQLIDLKTLNLNMMYNRRFYIINQLKEEVNSVYMECVKDLLNSCSDMIPVVVSFDKISYGTRDVLKGSIIEFLLWSDGVVFSYEFGDYAYLWVDDFNVEGPFSKDDQILQGWNDDYLIPCTGVDLLKKVINFRINDRDIPIGEFKSHKRFELKEYLMTNKEEEIYGDNESLVKKYQDRRRAYLLDGL